MPQSRTQRTTEGPASASKSSAGEMDSRLTALREQIETNQDQVCENAEAVPLPLLILHAADDKVAFANTAAEEAFGYARTRLIGRDWACLIPSIAERKMLKKLAAHDGRVKGFTVQGRRKDGELLWLTVWQQRTVCHGLECLLTVLVDVTQERLEAQRCEDRRKLLQQLLELSDHDRELIACDIHDGVIQDMTGALMHLEAARRAVQSGKPEAVEQLKSIMQMLRDGISEARRLIDGVRPPDLDRLGLVGAMESLIERTKATKKIDIRFEHVVSGQRLPEQAETALYRIVQESLNNVWQHSRSPRASVRLIHNDRMVRLSVRDWGAGFDPARVDNSRFGLLGIRQRARLLGGTVTIRSAPGKGCTVRVTLPLDKKGQLAPAGLDQDTVHE
jgi:PAS domain S-box-containing protein